MGNNKNMLVMRSFLYLGLFSGIYLFLYLFLHRGMLFSIFFSSSPLFLLAFLFLLKNPYAAFILLFIMNYVIMGVTRYYSLKGGIVIDACIGLVFLGILIRSIKFRWPWEILKNEFTLAASIWLLFCLLNLLNPLSPIEAWVIGIRRTAVYFFVIPTLTFLLFNRYKHLKAILVIWSGLVLLAVFKALIQKYIGFDAGEMNWLYEEGKARTHVIGSGVRYFSFFTDAANFGCGMAFAMVFFSISSLFMKSKFLKFYFFVVSIFATYGMLISGTRVAIAIPFVGYALFVLASKNIKIIVLGTVLVGGAFAFLNFTMYGQGNSYIRRMRTAFHPTKDASFMVRIENQKVMRAYLANKPLGVGIGTAKAAEYSDAEISRIPTDSWLVMVWVETGIIGLLLYLGLVGYILAKATLIVMSKAKNRELWGIQVAFLGGTAGIFVASYANEVIAQFPNGPIVYMSLAFIFMTEKYDQQLKEQQKHAIDEKSTSQVVHCNG